MLLVQIYSLNFAKLSLFGDLLQVKRSIKGIRQNVTNHLWHLALESKVLDEINFTKNASSLIQNFEGALVKAMTKDGWDGEEDENIVQWTRTGSLFYSIIVITTIGEFIIVFDM